ncbi:hypothetical protein J3F83DRAFT_746044 [Trichoderma novae-zelandiae]
MSATLLFRSVVQLDIYLASSMIADIANLHEDETKSPAHQSINQRVQAFMLWRIPSAKCFCRTTSRCDTTAFISSSLGGAAFQHRVHRLRAMNSSKREIDEARDGHLERTADEPREADLHEVRLERVEQVNERVRLFRLKLLSGPVKFLPGQWLDTYIPNVPKAGGFTITSAPSAALTNPPPSSSPSSTPYFELAVQESPDNEPAAWLWRPVGEILGARLRVRVGGRFVFPPRLPPPLTGEKDASTASDGDGDGDGVGVGGGGLKKVVFVAGGVGVNPLVSMLSYIAENSTANEQTPLVEDVVFLYASKMPRSGKLADILFLDRIARFFGEGKVKGRVKLFVTGAAASLQGTREIAGTREMNGARVEVQKRRITAADVEDAVADGRDPGTVVYVCGPRTMTDELAERLAGVMDPRRVLTEKWW